MGVARARRVWLLSFAWWWWPGFEWQGQDGGWVNWTVRRRLRARVARVGAMRIAGVMVVVVGKSIESEGLLYTN